MKNRTIHHQKLLFCSSILSSAIAATAVQADDIDIYLLPPQTPVYSNLLFLLDESGSMEENMEGGTRLSVLKSAMKDLLDSESMENFHISLMGYTLYDPGYSQRIKVHSDFTVVDDATRTTLKSEVDKLHALSGTPTIPALKAAVDWYINQFTEDTGITYDSPLKDTVSSNFKDYRTWHCTASSVVLLSDGQPNSNNPDYPYVNGDNAITEYPEGSSCSTSPPFASTDANDFDHTYEISGGRCGEEIASWAYANDFISDATLPTDASQGLQNVTVYTIGFGVGNDEKEFLEHIALAGGGAYYGADNGTELLNAFINIADEEKSTIEYTYNAPAIPFQADNAAISGNAMYLPLFEPSVTDFWKGNIKKYSIAYNNGFTIRGRSNVATETSTLDDGGFSGNGCIDRDAILLADSTDYWNNSGSSDGGNPLLGGAASNMAVSSGSQRELYTDIGLGNGSDLIADANRIHPDNHESDDGSNILTNTILDASNDTEALELLNWIAWTDADDSHEGEMGAPLHTQPQVVGDYVLVSTVEGILHAFNKDSDEGDEAWAYMPSELLSTIKRAKANVSLIDENSNSFSSPMYGLDGPMTIYETESDGKTYVVVGQRRGGRAYYALDITNPASPKFAWKIIGGTTSGFNKLGQTWSKPIFTKVEISGGTEKEVLIFGGGYDPAQDSKTSRTDDAMGNAIFIVDAADGSIIYTIANTGANLNIAEMKNAIASDILPVDINTNGYTDRIYAAGVGGRIIRVDIPDSGMGGASPTGGVIADINDGQSDYRRFFNTPEVGYYKRGGQQFLSLMLTSGNRTQPVGNSGADTNGLFTIKDFDIWGPPSSSYNTVTITDLFDASVNLDGNTSNDVDNVYGVDMDTTTSGVQAPKGWYVAFDSGEKGFSTVKIYDYAVLFTTFNGLKNISTDSCIPSVTCSTSYLYALNMLNGKARFADLTGIDGRTELKSPGMPPAPQLLFPQTTVDNPGGDPLIRLGGTVDAIVGLEKLFSWEDKFHPVSWEEVTD